MSSGKKLLQRIVFLSRQHYIGSHSQIIVRLVSQHYIGVAKDELAGRANKLTIISSHIISNS
jgi:hypothetical protein